MDYYKFLATQEFEPHIQIEVRAKLFKLIKLEREKVKIEIWLRRFYHEDSSDSGNEEDYSEDQQLRYEERVEKIDEEIEIIKEDIEELINNMD